MFVHSLILNYKKKGYSVAVKLTKIFCYKRKCTLRSQPFNDVSCKFQWAMKEQDTIPTRSMLSRLQRAISW